MRRIQAPIDSHMLQDLAVGRVLASRITDVMAKPSSKRHQEYMTLLNRQVRGYGDIDPADVYRDRELVPVALRAYESRHGVELQRGWFYCDSEYDFIGCRPDAVEGTMIGLTVHIRATEETYENAVADGLSAKNMRTAQASMGITGLPNWLHLNFWQDTGLRKRRLAETLFEKNPLADELRIKLAYFYCQAVQLHLT